MALSATLGAAGITPEHIDVKATVTLDKVEGGFTLSASHLEVKAKIPGGNQEAFHQAAESAKVNCPISKVLNAHITMFAMLET
jgi:lipoyl-dependent peroxiredoxin